MSSPPNGESPTGAMMRDGDGGGRTRLMNEAGTLSNDDEVAGAQGQPSRARSVFHVPPDCIVFHMYVLSFSSFHTFFRCRNQTNQAKAGKAGKARQASKGLPSLGRQARQGRQASRQGRKESGRMLRCAAETKSAAAVDVRMSEGRGAGSGPS